MNGTTADHDDIRLISQDLVPKLKARTKDAHKYSFGPVLVLGGSASMPGAALLSARSALRSGAGLVRVLHGPGWMRDEHYPEMIYLPIKGAQGYFDQESVSEVLETCEKAKALVVGPGLGNSQPTKVALKTFFLKLRAFYNSGGRGSCVVDADALQVFAETFSSSEATEDFSEFVVTPHPGEAARMLGCTTHDVQNQRAHTLQELVKKFKCTVVLKGAGSLVGSYQGEDVYQLAEGNPYMATAGSGDVLSGLIASAIAQDHSNRDAALLGAFIHARAGDRATKTIGGPITASLLIDQLPKLIGEFTERT